MGNVWQEIKKENGEMLEIRGGGLKVKLCGLDWSEAPWWIQMGEASVAKCTFSSETNERAPICLMQQHDVNVTQPPNLFL